jgi:hypothetical protein
VLLRPKPQSEWDLVSAVCLERLVLYKNRLVSFCVSSLYLSTRVCWPILCLCCPFMVFEGCLDSNPERRRSKQVCFQLTQPSKLSHPALYDSQSLCRRSSFTIAICASGVPYKNTARPPLPPYFLFSCLLAFIIHDSHEKILDSYCSVTSF